MKGGVWRVQRQRVEILWNSPSIVVLINSDTESGRYPYGSVLERCVASSGQRQELFSLCYHLTVFYVVLFCLAIRGSQQRSATLLAVGLA